MSQFEEDGFSLGIEGMIAQLEEERAMRRENLRRVGYAEYDRFSNRIRRFFQRLFGKEPMTREKWKAFVDQAIEKTK